MASNKHRLRTLDGIIPKLAEGNEPRVGPGAGRGRDDGPNVGRWHEPRRIGEQPDGDLPLQAAPVGVSGLEKCVAGIGFESRCRPRESSHSLPAVVERAQLVRPL